jgi:hypothetical protein
MTIKISKFRRQVLTAYFGFAKGQIIIAGQFGLGPFGEEVRLRAKAISGREVRSQLEVSPQWVNQ